MKIRLYFYSCFNKKNSNIDFLLKALRLRINKSINYARKILLTTDVFNET